MQRFTQSPELAAEVFSGVVKNKFGAQATAQGQLSAQLSPDAEELRGIEYVDWKKRTDYQDSLIRARTAMRAVGSGVGKEEGSLTTKQKIDVLNFNVGKVGDAFIANDKARNEVEVRLAKNREILRVEGKGVLDQRLFGTTTVEDAVDFVASMRAAPEKFGLAKGTIVSGKQAFDTYEEVLLRTNPDYVGTTEQKEALLGVLEATGTITSSKPRNDFDLIDNTRAALSDYTIDKVNKANLNSQYAENIAALATLEAQAQQFITPGTEGAEPPS